MGTAARRASWCAVGAFVLLSAGCGGGDSPVVQVATPTPHGSSTVAPPATTPPIPPASTTRAPSTATPGTTTAAPAPADGSCGTVTAASGLTLRVLPAAGVSCADAVGLVGRFQEQLAGRQPAGSSRPASAVVDGWLCVSGPPSSKGGTTCSLQDKTVFADVAAE